MKENNSDKVQSSSFFFRLKSKRPSYLKLEKRELKVRNPLEKFFNATPRGDDELHRLKFPTEGREQMVLPVDKNVLTPGSPVNL